jgi:hypothetical protein
MGSETVVTLSALIILSAAKDLSVIVTGILRFAQNDTQW